MNAEREQNIIGMLNTVMTTTEDINQVARYSDLLSEQDFSTEAARISIDHIKRFVASKEEFDLFTLKDMVINDPRCSDVVTGQIIIDACHRNAPSFVSLGTLISAQRKHSARIKALAFIESLHRQVNESDDLHKTAGQAISFFEGLAGNLSSRKNQSKHIAEVAREYVDQLQYDMDHKDEARGLTTGLQGLDRLLGLRKILEGTLMVIGARPGMGKTALMTYIMIAQARAKRDKTFICYSLEMPRVNLYQRIVKDQTGYSYEDTLEAEDDTVFMYASNLTAEMRGLNIYLNDASSMSIEDIEADARERAKDSDIGAIYVDYLTIMEMPKKDRHDLSVGEITRRFKKLSVELKCSVILLAQLNRNIDDQSRKDKRPVTKDLRDSGSIEQDADYILFPYRDNYYNPSTLAQNYCELILRKNRHGMVGTTYCRFKDGRFVEVDDHEKAKTACQSSFNNNVDGGSNGGQTQKRLGER